MLTMVCTLCAHINLEGSLLCAACGSPLPNGGPRNSKTELLSPQVANYRGQSRFGLVDFRESGEFIIVVEEQRLSITLAQGAVATIGRADHGYVPELDLSAFRGRELGVSRQHAMFHHENDLLFIIDLDSANGTMLGGIPLSPQQRRIIRDGDEIRLGKLRFHIYFE